MSHVKPQDAAAFVLAQSAVLQHTAAYQQRGCSLQFLRNSRTAGASGAWNTGILHVMQQRALQDSSSSSNDAPYGASGSLCSSSSSSSDGVIGSSKHLEDPCADVFVAFLGERARRQVFPLKCVTLWRQAATPILRAFLADLRVTQGLWFMPAAGSGSTNHPALIADVSASFILLRSAACEGPPVVVPHWHRGMIISTLTCTGTQQALNCHACCCCSPSAVFHAADSSSSHTPSPNLRGR
jgi:hypothetical protein